MKGDIMAIQESSYAKMYSEGVFTIPHTVIREEGGTTAEFAILMYVMSRTDSSVHPSQTEVKLWDILLRFPEDDPVLLATAIKRLAKKGLLDDLPEIEVDIVKLIEQKHNIEIG